MIIESFHIKFPFRIGSLWVELRTTWVGFGLERRTALDTEFYAGFLAGCWSAGPENRMAAE